MKNYVEPQDLSQDRAQGLSPPGASPEPFLKDIVKQLPVPVIIFDKDLCFMAASDRFFDESPLQREEVKPKDYWYKLVPDTPIKWKMIHQRCLKGEELKCDEDPFFRDDGSIEWWKWRITPWFWAPKKVGAIILYVENITAKKNTELSIHQTIKSLEKSNNNLSKFAHICAHDLNHSLRTISLYVQIIQLEQANQSNPILATYMDRIVETIDQMKNFIQSTLDLYQRKVKKLQLTPVCMNEVVNNAMMALNKEISQKQAAIHYENLPPILGNKGLMTQLIQNLISNSLKYRGDNPPSIHLSAVEKRDFLLFSVKDNGVGIEKKYLKKIFKERKRINPQDRQGSGLGLPHCNKIVKEHGGKIWATSALHEGTTIFFLLPKAGIPSYPEVASF
jgi:PAS domain S-box-containing protein